MGSETTKQHNGKDNMAAFILNRPSWLAEITAYIAKTDREVADKAQILADAQQYGDRLLERSCANHVTVSTMILNPAMDKMLMVYHNIYDSYAWTGGHADGAVNLMEKALEEAVEETGIHTLWPLTAEIIALDVLPVKAHMKKGKPVDAHYHYNVTYGIIAPEKQTLTVKPDENSDVAWIPLENWQSYCKEPHMVPVYEKILTRMMQLKAEKNAGFAYLPELLLPWFRDNARDLPWRHTDDPYKVWLSEIMLQQTRVEAVKGYYARFLDRLPTVEALAQAPEDQVLKLWEGLGYYSRAKNLQKAALEIMTTHGGVFPGDYEDIRKLPGIGDYTAGAIASVCFGLPKAAVDGNVLRVLSRYTEDYQSIDDPAVKKKFGTLLEENYPASGIYGEAARWFNQSLMELGATVCGPNTEPQCEICPLRYHCRSYSIGTAVNLPIKKKKAERKIVEKTVFLLRNEGRLAVQQRDSAGLLAGLWEFPNVDEKLTEQQALQQAEAWGVQPVQLVRKKTGKHVFTHLEWHMVCYEMDCEAMPEGFVWADADKMNREIALPTAFRIFYEG